MPNVLIFHLQRIIFDYQTFGNKKVNSKFEFPSILDLNRYAFKQHAKESTVVGSSDKESAELASLIQASDDDYVYRLVGVNIHRGVADNGGLFAGIRALC